MNVLYLEWNQHVFGIWVCPSCLQGPSQYHYYRLLECLIYCHRILNYTTLDQGNYFKAKEMCQGTPDHGLYYFYNVSIAAPSSFPLLE